MHILLPPSETKRAGGSPISDDYFLPHATALNHTRAQVRGALDDLMSDHDQAAKALKLGNRSRDELQHNLQFNGAPQLPAIERYTGVLYDALSVETLDFSAREWVDQHVSIQSALFGLVSGNSMIPAYRLSGSTRLPGLNSPMKRMWAAAHEHLDWDSLGWILDLRSKDYVALAPLPKSAGTFAEVMQRDSSGNVRSLNHFNKAAKGHLVRLLAEDRPTINSAHEFATWAQGKGVEVIVSDDATIAQVIFSEDHK